MTNDKSHLDNVADDPRDVAQQLEDELTIEQKETIGLSQGQIVRRRFFRHKGAMIALGVLIAIVLFVFSSVGTMVPIPKLEGGFGFAQIHIPGWWQWHWNQPSSIVNGGHPTFANLFDWGPHPFGQDEVGNDIFARVMRGTQQSLMVMVLYGALATILGIIIGGFAGYFGGWLDNLLMRLTDLFLVIPTLVFAAVIGQLAGQNPTLRTFGAAALGIMLGLVGWMGMARLVRGEFLTLREREFVDAARVAGASDARIIFRHILPNTLGVVIVSTTLIMSAAIILEANLSFLGFGILPPDISLGQIVHQYQGAFATRPWLFWFPAVFVVSIALCINFIGDGLRDAFDPRQQAQAGGSVWKRIRNSLRRDPVAGERAAAERDADAAKADS
ncbi:MAG: ABC transporter permease [Microbacteriaceae bacterium]|nr:ABC transporter permease [Microbacteriaceae bacterium]